jgi:phosphotransferase system IIB component
LQSEAGAKGIGAAIADALKSAGIRAVSTCGSRLLIELRDPSRPSARDLDSIGARAWVQVPSGVQIIIGPGAQEAADSLTAMIDCAKSDA